MHHWVNKAVRAIRSGNVDEVQSCLENIRVILDGGLQY